MFAESLLTQRGFNCFLCSVDAGESIADEIAVNLDQCRKLFLEQEPMDLKQNQAAAREQELKFVTDTKKPYFLVKMCEAFEIPLAKFYLTSSVSYVQCETTDEPSQELVKQMS